MLKAIISESDYESLSDETKKHYGKKGDRYHLSVESVDGVGVENIEKLKTTIQNERDATKRVERELKAFKGIDPDEARDALKKVDDMDNWDPEKKQEERLNKMRNDLKSKFDKEKREVEDERDSLRVALEDALIESNFALELAKYETVVEGAADLLMPVVKKQSRVETGDNGKRRAIVIGKDGTPRPSMETGSTDPMGIGELVKEMSASSKFSALFKGSGGAGSGAKPSRSNTTPTDLDLSKMSGVEQLKHARRMKAEASQT